MHFFHAAAAAILGTGAALDCNSCVGQGLLYRLEFANAGVRVTTNCVAVGDCLETDTVKCYRTDSQCKSLPPGHSEWSAQTTDEEHSCIEKDRASCMAAGNRCEFLFAEGSKGKCVAKSVPVLRERYQRVSFTEQSTACQDCVQATGGYMYKLEYGVDKASMSCVLECSAVANELDNIVQCLRTLIDCADLPAYLASTGVVDYPAETCFARGCNACKRAESSAKIATCQYLTMSKGEEGNITRCLPGGLATGESIQEVLTCPGGNNATSISAAILWGTVAAVTALAL